MTAGASAAYAQLLGLGLLWITCHCAGMCGPLLCGLDVTGQGTARGTGLVRGAGRLLLYQAGRGLTYAWLGGLCGLLGAGLRRGLAPAGALLSIGLGAALLLTAARRLLPAPPLRIGRRPVSHAGRLAHLQGRLLRLIDPAHPLRPLLLGAVLGLLSCTIPLWVLGLAALTGSPLHGAALMLLLIVMTTPVLLAATLLPRLVRAPLGRFASLLPALSGCWLLLVGAAGLGLIDHAHHHFSAGGRGFMVMFF